MKKYFSVFSGEVYELHEDYINYLDCGQLEITDMPRSICKKCYGRGYISRNSDSGHYNMCRCILRNADDSFLAEMSEKQVEDVTMHTKKDTFKDIVDDIYE